MRVLFCNYEYPPLGGGGGVVNALLAQEMAKRHEVTVLTSQGMGLPLEEIKNGVRIIRVPIFFRRQEAAANLVSLFMFIPMGIRGGKLLLKTNPFDIINTHFVLPTGPVGNALSSHSGIPNVLSLHGGDLYDPSKFASPHRHLLLRFWIRHLLKRADRIVGQSRNTLENMHRFYDQEMQGELIPLGIQRPNFDAAQRRHYGYKDDEILLVAVGRLVARKATLQLIKLMSSFYQEAVRLIIIGTGPEESILERETLKRGLGSQIKFVGYVEESEKHGIIQMSDIYVSTSQHEGFGLVFLEAMACGLPIICYDNGGQTDFLEDGMTGYLLPLNQLNRFEERCRSLIKDRHLRRRMGEENIKKVEEFYIDKCAKRYETVFQEVISSKMGKGS